VDAGDTVRRPRNGGREAPRAASVVAISVIGRAAAFAAALAAWACGGTAPGSPFEPDGFVSDDFPAGDAFVFGIAQDPATGAPLANLTVSLTPWEGAAFDRELASGTLAETVTDRLGRFSFSRIAPGPYVLFVRFHAGFLGYGEVVRVVEARTVPVEVTLQPAPLLLGFERPRDGGTVAVVDTAVVTFSPIRIGDLATLAPGTEGVYARVDVTSGTTDGGAPRPPLRFEVTLDDEALENGRVRVPLEVGGLAGTLRLQPFLGFELAYRDPRGGSGGLREVRGTAIQAVRR
jgi:hypothetical protein